MEEKKYSLKIGHLFPDLLNLYGDRGNISAMVHRMEWRGHKAEVLEYNLNSDINFNELDIVLLGGGSDREQLLVCKKLKSVQKDFEAFVNSGGVVLAVCGGYQLLGKYYKLKEQTIEGLGILDIYTELGSSRLIGNVVLNCNLGGKNIKIAGFENHGGRTFIGNHTPLGEVVSGFGNNEKDKKEGVLYKNVVATYLHGPLLPKNPEVTDYLLLTALKRKYGNSAFLFPLDDTLENEALGYCLKRFGYTKVLGG